MGSKHTTLDIFLRLKELAQTFICISEIDTHLGSSHRITLYYNSPVTLFIVGEKIVCKNKAFVEIMKQDELLKDLL